ncbi:PatB family C-S lyase [Pectobacterium polonicum]|uniref:MalY/PatB family protein n=1 Tax=Pectobacterium polonicum TaxID=2485124 RepID=UPI0010F43CBA|nr:PatB family C-S lyase [Pectobacterium polonicum]TKY83959.1 putative C-S lyase [Pectobacterium polonicum]
MVEQECIFDLVINRSDSSSIKWGRYERAGIISFGTADMDFPSPSCIRDALVRKAESGMYAYEYKPDTYYQAVTEWFKQNHRWNVKPEWLTNCPGMWALFSLSLQAYTQKGDAILLHAPHFHPAVSVIEGAGRQIVAQPLLYNGHHYAFDAAEFEQIIVKNKVKLFFLVNPHNPTGLMLSRKELSIVADICEQHAVTVVSDEINSYLIYDDSEFVPYSSVSSASQHHSVTLTSPSKAFNLQGLTYAIGIIPNRAMWEQLEKIRVGMDFDFATNIFSITAAEAAYRDGKAWLTELNAYLQKNLDVMAEFFSQNMPNVRLIRPGGGYIAWLDFTAYQLSAEELKSIILDKAGVGLTWGETFGPQGDGFERINFACPRAVLLEGLERLKQAFS